MSSTRQPRLHVERACQLEAERLDVELEQLLLQHVSTAFRFFHGGNIPPPSPEMRLAMSLLLHATTTLLHRPSPGKALHNLRFRLAPAINSPIHPERQPRFGDERAPLALSQRVLILLLDAILPYLWRRAHSWALRESDEDSDEDEAPAQRWRVERLPGSWKRRIARAMSAADIVARAMLLANMLSFLSHGRYPTLSHRLVGAGMCYADVGATRAVSFEFVNRQLVWSGFAEFLVFLTPVVWSPRVRRMLTRGFAAIVGGSSTDNRVDGDDMETTFSEGEESNMAIERRCAGCGVGRPVMPYVALPCRHVYCYVCLAVSMEQEANYSCKRCGVTVHASSRVTSSGCL